MSSKISPKSYTNEFKDYVTQKRWVAIAILISSVAIFGTLMAVGGLGLFSSNLLPSWIVHALGTIGHKGALAAFALGFTGASIGVLISSVLLIKKGRTPLHHAIERKESIKDHINANAINKPDHNGNRPLHYAVLHEHEIESLLSEKSIEINAKNNNDETPLLVAVMAGKKSAVEELIANSSIIIDKKIVNWALCNGSEGITMLLLENIKIESTLRKALLTAVENGQKRYLDKILEKYESTDNQDLHDAVVLAARMLKGDPTNYDPIFDAILNKGVNVNAQSNKFNGRSSLHQAANMNNVTLVAKLLLKKDVDVNLKDNRKKTPLDLAMEWPWLDLAVLIIESNKVSNENLQKAKEVAAKTTNGSKGGTDCSRVIVAIDKCLQK